MDTMRAAYHEVYVYTMGRPGFILQHVVDAFAVQSVSDDSRPIGLVFGLVGRYLAGPGGPTTVFPRGDTARPPRHHGPPVCGRRPRLAQRTRPAPAPGSACCRPSP